MASARQLDLEGLVHFAGRMFNRTSRHMFHEFLLTRHVCEDPTIVATEEAERGRADEAEGGGGQVDGHEPATKSSAAPPDSDALYGIRRRMDRLETAVAEMRTTGANTNELVRELLLRVPPHSRGVELS